MYDNNSDIFGFIYNDTEYYYIKNAQNDVIAIADSNGNVLARYYYDAWGKVLEITGNTEIANLNPIRYRSYYYDAETGWYYLNTRYYSADMCRFINADGYIASIGGSIQGYNMFAFCFNNPTNMSDSFGCWPRWIKNAANWINNHIIKPVANFFSPRTNTISGQFRDGIFRGSGSLTGGYSEVNRRLQVNSKGSKKMECLVYLQKHLLGIHLEKSV